MTHKHDERTSEDLPDCGIGVASSVQAEASDERYLRLSGSFTGSPITSEGASCGVVKLDMHAFLGLLLFFILTAGFGQGLRGSSVPDIRCLRYKKEDADSKDAKENRADAEGPLIAQIFDDIAGDEARSSNAAEQK